MADYFSAAGDLFQGIGSLFGGLAEAKGYSQAASFERQNAVIERESGAINQLRQQREALKSFGQTITGYAGVGISSKSGDALYALAEAHRNAALDTALINLQTTINVNADLAKASEYTAEAQAKSGGGIFGFLGSVASAIALI